MSAEFICVLVVRVLLCGVSMSGECVWVWSSAGCLVLVAEILVLVELRVVVARARALARVGRVVALKLRGLLCDRTSYGPFSTMSRAKKPCGARNYS